MNIVEERIKKWKEKLIDLSNRNRLLNFRPTKVTTIKIVEELPVEIFKIVVVDNKAMEFLPVPESKEQDLFQGEIGESSREFSAYKKEELDEKYTDKYLQTNLKKEQLNKNLFRIYTKASSVMEEQGYNVLFLALGCLEWYESDSSEIKHKAPLILVPVELSRKSVKGSFKLKFTEESPIFNPALLLKLKKEFGITLNIDDDFSDESVEKIFLKVKKGISKFENWKITNDIYLSLFSFAKFVMYKDIDKNFKTIIENPLIRLICGDNSQDVVPLGISWEPEELEKELHPQKTFQILDADSSQQQAILAIKKGRSLLIEGPPGTGKSQTIANIIAESIAEGKKVLFVSQKMAALEVVKKRLENSGLGDFCLELHSRKTNRTRVIKELAASVEQDKKPDHSHDAELMKLQELREQLNLYVRELHSPFGNLKITPFQAIGIIHSSKDIGDLKYIFQNIEEWNKKQFLNCCEVIDTLSQYLQKIGKPKDHPWYGSNILELTYQEKLDFVKHAEMLIEKYHSVQQCMTLASNLISFKPPLNIEESEALLEALELLIDFPSTSKSILENDDWNSVSPEVIELVSTVKDYNNFISEIGKKYSLKVEYITNIEDLLKRYERYSSSKTFFLKTYFWKDRKELKKFIKSDYKPKLKDIVDDLVNIERGIYCGSKIEENGNFGMKLFGKLWKGKDSDGEELEIFSQKIARFRKFIINELFKNDVFEKMSSEELDKRKAIELLKKSIDELKAFKGRLETFFGITRLNPKKAFGDDVISVPFEHIIKKVIAMKDKLENVDLWIRYQNNLKLCEDAKIDDFVFKLIDDNMAFEKMESAFKVQFLRCWLDYVFTEKTALKKFYSDEHEKLIKKFRDIDKKQTKLARHRICHLLSGKIDSSWQAAKGSELGILLREAKKMRAHMPLRILFAKIPHLINELKPCLMMGPLTVAQFINPKLAKFDLVIFDEASQIPPEDSIGALMRGKQIVIAGDSKQLPPTSFFQTEVLTPEDEKEFDELLPDDLASILDECSVTNFPKCMLRWHYRSRHEALIDFSNKSFYDSRLNTFPCAEEDSRSLGIKFNYIPGTVYDRGGSGTNLEEAREVAKAVFEHFRKYPDLSLGVGTFSIRQKNAIEDAIEEMLKEDNSLESYFTKDKFEHFFVKNLEIIQGDERDVIFISVGYGKDKNGKLPMNFGPINKTGGHRRLNVLVTRARNRVEIFSSIKGEDFDLSKTNSIGVHLLKKYLEYAEKGKEVLLQNIDETGGESDSPFEEAVYEALRENNVKVRKQVGCSGYKIDLAVVDDEKPGKYILGIECDGASYHSCLTARDRDRLRQQVLEDLGWNIYRVWSTDWFKHTERELKKLLEEIERIKGGNFKKKIDEAEAQPINLNPNSTNKHPKDKATRSAKPYFKIPLRRVFQTKNFYDSPFSKIGNVLADVVNYEGPIHRKEAARRVASFWNIAAVKSRVREIYGYAERACLNNKKIRKQGDFLWPKNMKIPQVRSRSSDEVSMDIDLICQEEIGEAALIVLEKEYSMPKEDLINQIARLLGFNRVTNYMYKVIESALSFYKRKKKILEQEGRFLFHREN